MDWATAAAIVSDRQALSEPPDAPGDDWDFWAEVSRLVDGGELEESIYSEILHPRDRTGKWTKKLADVARTAHEGQTDKSGEPYFNHVLAVADSVRPEARGVALFHDALEDSDMTRSHLDGILTGDEVEAVSMLTHDDAVPYKDYIEGIATAPGRAGELAREVKRADLQHNLGRLGNLDAATQARLRPKYEAALARLTPEVAPVEQRGKVFNRAQLDEAETERRLEEMYRAAVKGGHAEHDANWYQDAHDLIWEKAEKLGMDPHALAAIVAATSPRNRWIWPEGTQKAGTMPNMRAALKTVAVARRHPNDPAPAIAARPKPGMLRDSLEKSIRLYRGEDPDKVLVAPKTRSFYNNLAFPEQASTITIDTLMARAALGETARADYDTAGEIVLGDAGGKSGYRWMVDRVQALADKHGLKPHEMQAAIWREQQRRQDADLVAEETRRKQAAAKAKQTRATNRRIKRRGR